MTQPFTYRKYLDALKQKTIIFDGAMGTSLQALNLTAEDFGGEKTNGCNDYLVISAPWAVEKVHRSFLEVGADVLETDTFRSNRLTLKEYGLEDRVIEINETAAKLARKLAEEYSTAEHPRFVAGSIGPSGKLPSMSDPELSNVTFDELADVFREQAVGLLKGGVDLIIIETTQDILELKAAIVGVQNAFNGTGIRVPIQAQVTLDTTGRMLLGTDISAVQTILAGMQIDILGMNCSTGPEHMRAAIRYLGENSPLPISCIPNAGMPQNVNGQAVYGMEPDHFANELNEFVTKHHVAVVGGCCGTTPEHIAALVSKLSEKRPQSRVVETEPMLASSIQTQAMVQVPPPFIIGERLNTQGSKKFKQLILEDRYDELLQLAQDQADSGAHGLDICVALTERSDEQQIMHEVIHRLSSVIKLPFVIDTTEPAVMEEALKTAPGRCMINSIHLEAGETKARKLLEMAKKYNAAVLALTIDETGMAKTAERKLEVAKRIYDLAVKEYGLQPHDLVFDTLTFTLATGEEEYKNSAVETIEGIRLIEKELPGVLTSLGVSNVSFGLSPSARHILNSVMLYHCVQAGMDMAIVHAGQIRPYAEIPAAIRELADDLILNRHPDALQRFIEATQQSKSTEETKETEQKAALRSMAPEERIHWKIVHRHKEDIEQDIESIIQRGEAKNEIAVGVLNNVLLPAMKEVGDKFGSGELILPFVLQSAEVMKKAVSYTEQYLEKKEGASKGKIVVATVYGDVHDIGKNLVKTILSNNGYEVVDLGKQVPAETIISRAVEENADAIGLSALLVSTSKQMPLIVNELGRRGLKIPVLVGGAAINKRFGWRILVLEDGNYYEPGVAYCKDAFEGLSTMDTLMNDEKRSAFLEKLKASSAMEMGRALQSTEEVDKNRRSPVDPAGRPPEPPFWGTAVVRDIPLDDVFDCLNLNELYRLSWGAKNAHGEQWEKSRAEFDQKLEQMRLEAHASNWLKPQAVYGYFPVQAEGNQVIVYDPEKWKKGEKVEVSRLSFPRQRNDPYLCLADFFNSVESGVMDVAPLQVVTVGLEATKRIEHMQNDALYTDAYFNHGLAVQMAEATAEYLHRRVRKELGVEEGQGKRYSCGYPSIPDLEDHEKVFELLPARKELGLGLSPAFQILPEQSTAAIVLHHAGARYFNIGESRVGQLLG